MGKKGKELVSTHPETASQHLILSCFHGLKVTPMDASLRPLLEVLLHQDSCIRAGRKDKNPSWASLPNMQVASIQETDPKMLLLGVSQRDVCQLQVCSFWEVPRAWHPAGKPHAGSTRAPAPCWLHLGLTRGLASSLLDQQGMGRAAPRPSAAHPGPPEPPASPAR